MAFSSWFYNLAQLYDYALGRIRLLRRWELCGYDAWSAWRLLVSRAPGGSGQSGWVYTFKPQYTQVNTGTHYGYFSATVPGLNNTCYGVPADYDKVWWAIPDPVYKNDLRNGWGEIPITLNNSSIDLNQWYKWGKGTLAADGKIFAPPARAQTKEILIIDTNNKTAEIGPPVPVNQNPDGLTLYDSSCMGKYGKIYYSPVRKLYMISFDPTTQTFDHWDELRDLPPQVVAL